MMKRRMAAVALSGSLLLSGGMIACDAEDERDLREGVNDVKETGEEVGKDVEDAVDEEVDTDGKDD
jgi:hypothetical protein